MRGRKRKHATPKCFGVGICHGVGAIGDVDQHQIWFDLEPKLPPRVLCLWLACMACTALFVHLRIFLRVCVDGVSHMSFPSFRRWELCDNQALHSQLLQSSETARSTTTCTTFARHLRVQCVRSCLEGEQVTPKTLRPGAVWTLTELCRNFGPFVVPAWATQMGRNGCRAQ